MSHIYIGHNDPYQNSTVSFSLNLDMFYDFLIHKILQDGKQNQYKTYLYKEKVFSLNTHYVWQQHMMIVCQLSVRTTNSQYIFCESNI